MIMVGTLSAVLLVVGASFSLSVPGVHGWAVLLPLATTASFLVAGMIAWRRRPHNRIGLLMLLTGLSMWLAGLVDAPVAFLSTLGVAAQTLPLALTLHLLLAFPSGRVRGRFVRVLVVIGYVTSTVLQMPSYLFGSGPLAVWSSSTAHSLLSLAGWFQTAVGVLSLLAASAVVAVRARRSHLRERPQVEPMVWYRILAPLVIGGAAVMLRFSSDAAALLVAGYAQLAAILGLPLVFLIGLLFGSFGRAGEVNEMVVRIAATTPRAGELTAAVAVALGDPGAAVVYACSDGAGFVDDDGREVAIPVGGDRQLYAVWHSGRVVGGIVHNTSLIADTAILAVLGGIVAMAIDEQRLVAEQRRLVADLRARELDLRHSGRRLLQAEDAERRRIARDLHDGAQQHIVVLGLKARRLSRSCSDPDAAAAAAWIADGMTGLLAEFRALIAGIMPAPLLDRGLVPAVELLAERMPIPTTVVVRVLPDHLPAEAESTLYFMVSEALANVAKHSRATSARVIVDSMGEGVHQRLVVTIADDGAGGADLAGGTGLHGLVDRIATLGGSVRIDSASGAGTTVGAEIPCG